jgi:hypothetical protein
MASMKEGSFDPLTPKECHNKTCVERLVLDAANARREPYIPSSRLPPRITRRRSGQRLKFWPNVPPVHMLDAKNVNPSITAVIEIKPLLALRGTAVNA